MNKRYKGTFHSKTDIGRVRINNEDQSTVLINHGGEVLLVVCDGMGGSNKGELASKTAVDILTEDFQNFFYKGTVFMKKQWFYRTIRRANSEIYKLAEENAAYEGMGTTLVAALITGNRIIVANIGDSRAYSLGEAGFKRLTEDQTYVDYLYRTGKIDEKTAESHPDRHVLTNALGIYPTVSVDMRTYKYNGESILLCSDGLYNNVSEADIKSIIATDERADQKVDSLINYANANGGSDNVGIAFWEPLKDD